MCARPLRVQYPGAFYHVMNRGNASGKIFRSERDFVGFLNLLGETVEKFKIRVHAFCLMTNHYHLLVETPLGNLARAMRHQNGVYTQRYNRQRNLEGHLFRGRYKSILVEEEAYLVELLRYLHLNPVKAKLVLKPEAYAWSSHRYYLGGKVLDWLTTGHLLSYFGKRRSKARRKLHEFVLRGVPEKLDVLLRGKKWPSVFSSEHFENWVEWNFVRDLEDKEVKYEPQFPKILTAEEMEAILVKVFERNWKELIAPVGYEGKRLRRIALKSFHEYTCCSYGDLCKKFGGINAATISRALKDPAVKQDLLWEILSFEVSNAHFAHCKT